MAYIDPGSGSMLVQVLVASALGSVIAFRRTLLGLIAHLKPGPQRHKDGPA